MAIVRNITGRWFKLSEQYPAPAFGDSGPKWEFIGVAKNKAQADEWKALNIRVKAAEVDGRIEYTAKFQKACLKRLKAGQDVQEKNKAPKVVNGSLKEIDPQTLANGSVVNIEIFQHPFEVKSDKPGGPTKKGISTILMSVQVVKHVVYVAKPREGFDMTETETVMPETVAESMDESSVVNDDDDDADF